MGEKSTISTIVKRGDTKGAGEGYEILETPCPNFEK